MSANIKPLRNPVSGEVKELGQADFLELFDPGVHSAIKKSVNAYPDCEAVVCMEVLDMSSSRFGDRSALVMGPSNSWPLSKVEEAGFRLGDIPSRFQYPTAVWRVKENSPEFR